MDVFSSYTSPKAGEINSEEANTCPEASFGGSKVIFHVGVRALLSSLFLKATCISSPASIRPFSVLSTSLKMNGIAAPVPCSKSLKYTGMVFLPVDDVYAVANSWVPSPISICILIGHTIGTGCAKVGGLKRTAGIKFVLLFEVQPDCCWVSISSARLMLK